MNELAGNTARGQEYNEMQTQTTLYKCFGFLLGNTTHTLTTATIRIHCIYSQIGRLCQCLCKRMATKAAAMGHGTQRTPVCTHNSHGVQLAFCEPIQSPYHNDTSLPLHVPLSYQILLVALPAISDLISPTFVQHAFP